MQNSTNRISRALLKAKLAAKRLRDESGNVAIITAIMLPVLIAVAGFSMDYSYAAYVKKKLDKAAEAAVIGAVSQSAATSGGGYSNKSWLQSYGTDIFSGNVSQLSVGNVSKNLTVVSNSSNGVTANISYSGSVPTLFSGIIGINSIPVSGTATATASPITYINYYIVVDISQSMGIGSTATDMQNLYNRVVSYNNGSGGETGCVFGCHVKAAGQTYTNEYLAHSISPAITLRIDSAVSAIQSIISDAQAAAGTNQNIKIGLYTMSENPVSGVLLNTVSAPSSNYTSLTSLAATIDLGNNVSGGDGDSDFVDQLSQFNTILPANGSGASASSPLNYVFIVTDGLIDTPGGGCTSGHCTGAFSPSYCTNLKAKSTVGVIYTTYLPIYNQNNSANGYETNYTSLVLPYVNNIAPNLEDCATSSTYYFQASDGPAIATAMQALFAATQQAARLTN
jgi:Flp pilus assembly protein TadG